MILHTDTRVERDDRRRSLLCTQAVVVPSCGDGAPNSITVLVDGVCESCDESSEVGLTLSGLTWCIEVLATVRVEAPVVVLAGAVDACEGLLMPEHHQIVASSDVVRHLHGKLVLIVSDVG